MSDGDGTPDYYSGLPAEPDRRSRMERLGCGLGCVGFAVGAGVALVIAGLLLWAIVATR